MKSHLILAHMGGNAIAPVITVAVIVLVIVFFAKETRK